MDASHLDRMSALRASRSPPSRSPSVRRRAPPQTSSDRASTLQVSGEPVAPTTSTLGASRAKHTVSQATTPSPFLPFSPPSSPACPPLSLQPVRALAAIRASSLMIRPWWRPPRPLRPTTSARSLSALPPSPPPRSSVPHRRRRPRLRRRPRPRVPAPRATPRAPRRISLTSWCDRTSRPSTPRHRPRALLHSATSRSSSVSLVSRALRTCATCARHQVRSGNMDARHSSCLCLSVCLTPSSRRYRLWQDHRVR